MSRLFAICDIHGEHDKLQALLKKLNEEEQLDLTQDKLVFLGDYCDRGPNTKGVLDTVRSLTEAHPGRVIALAGNHEWITIEGSTQSSDYNKWGLWMANGGGATLESFAPHTRIPDEYVRWMSSLPTSHEEPGFFFSHAPVPRESWRSPFRKGQPFNQHELTWTYDADEKGIARNFKKDDNKDVIGVCGHVHRLWDREPDGKRVMRPRFYDHYIYGDAGCGCHPDAPLCAIEVKTRKVIYSN